MDVLISIVGTQQSEGESNTIELTTAGQMEKTDTGYLLTYNESATTGMEGVMTSMRVCNSEVILERSGKMNSMLVLQKGRRHMCNYETGYGSMMMGIYTRELHNLLDDQGGELDFDYTMDINSSMTSSHNVHISVKTMS